MFKHANKTLAFSRVTTWSQKWLSELQYFEFLLLIHLIHERKKNKLDFEADLIKLPLCGSKLYVAGGPQFKCAICCKLFRYCWYRIRELQKIFYLTLKTTVNEKFNFHFIKICNFIFRRNITQHFSREIHTMYCRFH